MKKLLGWVMCFAGIAFASCRTPDPPPPAGGVSVRVPGVRVNVNDYETSVSVPGTQIRVPQ